MDLSTAGRTNPQVLSSTVFSGHDGQILSICRRGGVLFSASADGTAKVGNRFPAEWPFQSYWLEGRDNNIPINVEVYTALTVVFTMLPPERSRATAKQVTYSRSTWHTR